jgi:hypothetical protein
MSLGLNMNMSLNMNMNVTDINYYQLDNINSPGPNIIPLNTIDSNETNLKIRENMNKLSKVLCDSLKDLQKRILPKNISNIEPESNRMISYEKINNVFEDARRTLNKK